VQKKHMHRAHRKCNILNPLHLSAGRQMHGASRSNLCQVLLLHMADVRKICHYCTRKIHERWLRQRTRLCAHRRMRLPVTSLRPTSSITCACSYPSELSIAPSDSSSCKATESHDTTAPDEYRLLQMNAIRMPYEEVQRCRTLQHAAARGDAGAPAQPPSGAVPTWQQSTAWACDAAMCTCS
jgi:hypothetical protein